MDSTKINSLFKFAVAKVIAIGREDPSVSFLGVYYRRFWWTATALIWILRLHWCIKWTSIIQVTSHAQQLASLLAWASQESLVEMPCSFSLRLAVRITLKMHSICITKFSCSKAKLKQANKLVIERGLRQLNQSWRPPNASVQAKYSKSSIHSSSQLAVKLSEICIITWP